MPTQKEEYSDCNEGEGEGRLALVCGALTGNVSVTGCPCLGACDVTQWEVRGDCQHEEFARMTSGSRGTQCLYTDVNTERDQNG